METGDDATGDRHEEQRENRAPAARVERPRLVREERRALVQDLRLLKALPDDRPEDRHRPDQEQAA